MLKQNLTAALVAGVAGLAAADAPRTEYVIRGHGPMPTIYCEPGSRGVRWNNCNSKASSKLAKRRSANKVAKNSRAKNRR